MSPTLPTRRIGFRPRATWAGAAVLSLGFLFGSSSALAAPPPANTVIGNQASATYSDSSGTTQLATSNLVQTTVQQVGSFTLDTFNQVTTTIVNTKLGAAGSVVYAPHILTNTGNGSDTFTITVDADNDAFSKVEVYPDANGDGMPDSTTPLCTAAPAAVCSVPAQTVPGNNGTFQFVVAYTIPGTATTPTTPFDTATITATPGTPALYTAPNTAAADKDQVNLTTQAAFGATKSIGVPAVAAPPGAAWPLASTGGPRSSSASCSTIWGAGIASSDTCKYTVYTLTFNNTGGAPGKFALSDTLPSGFTYVAGSAVWSSAPGVALGDGAAGDPAGMAFQVAGNTLNVVIDSLGQNVTQTISFVVLVNNTAVVGTSTTTNVAQYNPTDSPNADVTAIGTLGSTTNPAAYTVVASYGLVVGTNPSTAATAVDTVAGTPNGTAADTTTQPSVVAGGSVKFPQTVFNTGSGVDSINLSIANGSFPAGTTFLLFAADGVTPLLDTTGDGVPDTGPIPVGGSANIVVQANVPASATVGSGPFNAVLTGRSANDPTKLDATLDQVTIVVGSLVDLTNSAAGTGSGSVAGGDLGPGPSPQPTTTNSTPAGTGTIFTLFVKNNDAGGPATQTYTLAASQSTGFPGTLPAGWTVKFVAAGGTCAAAAITDVTVARGAQLQVDACVTPPATQTPVTSQPIYFRVQSTAVASTGVLVSDAKQDAVTVTTAATLGATLTPNNVGQVAPGGTVVYAHTLTNIGNQSCGAYTLTATVPAADAALGWTTAIYLDVNGDGQIDAGDTLVTGPIAGPLAAGATQKLLVRVFAPGGASAGATDTTTVTATFTDPAPNCGTPSATDISTVITGQIRVLKTQAADVACDGTADGDFFATPLSLKPGQCIVYRVVATNEGTAPITNIAINDAAPAFTSLVGATQPPALTQCVSTGVTGTALVYAQTPTAVSCGSAANTVAPGGSATLTFAVRINQ
ncbi:beta strand repeat-containing protein [Variovorax sp. CCNWLW235]|uniref:beta strand repeat-containing protein n=1 Tax=Variovorax sp. CCNWLW235 TaxID=3127463 RepID=UPI0030781C05